jgi:hypothetical protein
MMQIKANRLRGDSEANSLMTGSERSEVGLCSRTAGYTVRGLLAATAVPAQKIATRVEPCLTERSLIEFLRRPIQTGSAGYTTHRSFRSEAVQRGVQIRRLPASTETKGPH